MTEFKMPSLGADMESGILRDWKVKIGDKVKRGDIIAEIETQKGLIEIEVFEEGTIEKLLVKKDEKVLVGSVIANINTDKDQAAPLQSAAPPSEIITKIQTDEKPFELTSPPAESQKYKASPLAKKIAQENKIDISSIKGSGENGVITKEDVENVIKNKSTTTKVPETELIDSIRAAIASAMSKSNREIPHYYLETTIDMRKTISWLTEKNKTLSIQDRILIIAIIVKAIAKSLSEAPELNGHWENSLQIKNEINIGLVVSLRTGGLMIPSILNVENKSIDEIMRKMTDLIPRARSLKLRSSEVGNSTITVTNIGDNGIEKVFGVIYPPQVAIVGLGSIVEQPFSENGMLDVRPVMTVTLAGDHRATDGHTGSRFLISLKNNLQNPENL